MLFHTPIFLGFLGIVFCLYYFFPRLRLYLLTLANIIFYLSAGVAYFFVFIGIVTLSYYISRGLLGKYGKWSLIGSISLVLGNLLFFKYSLFLLRNVEKVLGIGLNLQSTFWADLVLPIGISFYTFQIIAYVTDVYKRKLEPAKSWIEFWTFISLFIHSAAGPILRGKEFLPQLRNIQNLKFKPTGFKLGIAYITMGLAKKLLLADQIAPEVNAFFARSAELSGAEAWVAAYLFAFQIYMDFSAYSDMAVGIGHLLGLRIDLNFRTPYLSANSGEFWRRWHITLSGWIRDYIYIPLGGSRVSKLRSYANLVFAMTLSGLWHGAAWTFIIWGLYHGFLQVGHHIYKGWIQKLGWEKLQTSRLYRVVAVFVFFHLVVIGWVFFRAQGISNALHMVKVMLTMNPLHIQPAMYEYLAFVAALFLLHMLEAYIVKRFSRLSLLWQLKVPALVRAAVYTIIIIVLQYNLEGEHNSFIYFQF
ncbi:MBOAT family protein [Paenibacillus albiflavus]|uniref:MBOAT family protein n=1 Tax=Paenibacillus albiflavus TaxID=2545760 RepID=A0A4R4DYX9_9BACL|nr:MBOAT family O-acyltransferase [Paenibacillus albiflavus]TCZ69359.1 MBOAT family protein [Paenibacillus albiflavus]